MARTGPTDMPSPASGAAPGRVPATPRHVPPLRKAVIPVGGLGTRFLPVTKAQPKEMLPLIDVPTIQVVVEEAVAAGIRDIILVTGRHKRAIEDHFDRNLELEVELERRGQAAALAAVRRLADLADIHYIRQPEPLGLGDAVLRAHAHVGEEAFAVLLADDIILSEQPCTAQLADVYAATGRPVVAVQTVPDEELHRYGVVKPAAGADGRTIRCADLVEKPTSSSAPSNLAVVGRYVLTAEVWPLLEHAVPGAGGEIQLTDALAGVARAGGVYAHRFEGTRFDVGEPAGLVKATVMLALQRPSLRDEVMAFLREAARAGIEAATGFEDEAGRPG